jgi:hypothetical protein
MMIIGASMFIIRSIYVGEYATEHLQGVNTLTIILIELPW